MQLNNSKIEYTLFHLAQHWEVDKEISELFCFEPFNTNIGNSFKNQIIFPLSLDENIDPLNVTILNSDIPILFPIWKDKKELFFIDNNDNLIFTHDYLKSSFYLLSGFQELNSADRDFMGRFKFENSIQKKLNCVTIPVVNYYFDIILQGLELYCATHGLHFKRKRLFENFGFLLSHDVDHIAFWHWRATAYRLKQLLGLAPTFYSKSLTFKLLIKGLFVLINPFYKKDPWWNFEKMVELENKLKIKSSFYFLRKEDKNDSQYHFDNKKINGLITTLYNDGFEIGLHGTIKSAENINSMISQIELFKKEFDLEPIGIRQHFLRFFHPKTFILQQESHLMYDTTLTFAEHDGYRNGYCYPFRPFNFERDEIMNIWEIPLIMMEVSMLHYRNLSFNDLQQSALNHIVEAKKFGGIFSLLWHNSRLTEYEYPNITTFYEQLLKEIVDQKPKSVTGAKLIFMIGS
ncbi:MAG: hypothetical protein FWH18_08200 [Marinilabiliaceae bacterium]|nr:hypothetical protein [Marinilabiliaceae bacterium]